ncbi:hypothetical protein BGP_0092 [Beggiatoa sp. PS]|nr:hypothetical protein BGP_0092 [Beggiatoa sp. PS]
MLTFIFTHVILLDIIMSEYTLQVSEDLFSTVQKTAKKMRMSTHQFLLAAIREKLSASSELENDSDEQKNQGRLGNTVIQDDEENWGSFLRTARSLPVEGPPDWSERIDDYLYGNQVMDDGK